MCARRRRRRRRRRKREESFQSWEDHSENHPTLNPPAWLLQKDDRSSMPRLHGNMAVYYSRPRHEALHTLLLCFSYIKRSMKNIRIKARKEAAGLSLDCHWIVTGLSLDCHWTGTGLSPPAEGRAESCEIHCLYPSWQMPHVWSTQTFSNVNHSKHLGLRWFSEIIHSGRDACSHCTLTSAWRNKRVFKFATFTWFFKKRKRGQYFFKSLYIFRIINQ